MFSHAVNHHSAGRGKRGTQFPHAEHNQKGAQGGERPSQRHLPWSPHRKTVIVKGDRACQDRDDRERKREVRKPAEVTLKLLFVPQPRQITSVGLGSGLPWERPIEFRYLVVVRAHDQRGFADCLHKVSAIWSVRK
jgi:hypothetical protein